MVKQLIFPKGYHSLLDFRQTEKAIKEIKDFFQLNLSSELRLTRVTAPLFVMGGTGINDDLNGVENPVRFTIRDCQNQTAEIVHSLAKWKRVKLADYNIKEGYGIYADMNAIRADETLDNLHSLYVDQWDWEKVITVKDRNLAYLKKTVRHIWSVLKRCEFFISERYPLMKPFLPDEITFLHAEELMKAYPDLTPYERENRAAKAHGAIFVIGIGSTLEDGLPHDDRAPDYDDWSSQSVNGYKGLNGDIIVYHPILKCAYELSSMGIRVDEAALTRQLEMTGLSDRSGLLFHKKLLNGELPLSIGGGIGQSRLCMLFLKKAHIGEVQASIWPDEMSAACRENGIELM